MDSNMEFYTTEFNNLNKLNLDAKHLFCSICKDLLTSKIYTSYTNVVNTNDGDNIDYSSCVNICKTCHGTNEDVSMYTANHYLTGMLSKAEFLCLKNECDFVGTQKEYEQHTSLCNYQAMKCLFDNKKFNDITGLMKHLSLHENVTKICMEQLHVIDVKLPSVEKCAVFMATIKQNTFILVFQRAAGTLTLEVGHMHMFKHFISYIDKFTVIYQSEDIQMRQMGVMQELHAMLRNAGNDDRLKLKLNSALLQGGDISIYVNMDCMDIYKNKLEACPICLQEFTTRIRQCKNGHSLCPPCTAKITSCPICRQSLTANTIKLQHILDVNAKCKNSDAGCHAIGDLKAHKNNCPFMKYLCSQCNTQVCAHEFYNHFAMKHVAHENFLFKIINIDTAKPEDNVFIKYRANIFCFEIVFEGDLLLKFSVRTLPSITFSWSQYKFKVILYDNGQRVIAETGCDCDGAIVSIQLSSFAPSLYIQCGKYYKGDIMCEFKILRKSNKPIDQAISEQYNAYIRDDLDT